MYWADIKKFYQNSKIRNLENFRVFELAEVRYCDVRQGSRHFPAGSRKEKPR